MATISALQRGVSTPILVATTTGTSSSFAVPVNQDNVVLEVTGAGTISGGTVVLEENITDPAYSGTWSTIATITASTLTAGAKQTFHIANHMQWFRARITSNITGGGTIAVDAVGA